MKRTPQGSQQSMFLIPFGQIPSHKDIDMLWTDSCNMGQIETCLFCNTPLTVGDKSSRFCNQCYVTLRTKNR